MSSIASNSEDLILNADGGSSTVKIKINGTEKASISSAGAFTSTTIDATALTGNLPAISGASLTGVLPLSGGTLTGDLLVTSTQPNIRLTDSDSGGYYSKVAQEGASMKIVADLGEVGSGRLRFYNGSGAEKLEITSDGRGLSQFTAKVWVHIDSGTLADGHNVSSITDNGTGEYQVNFANNLANDNYSSTTSNPYRNGSSRRALVNTYNPNVNNINIAVFEYNHSNSNGFYAYDLDKCTMTIFGD